MGFLGMELDPARNATQASTISRNESRVAVRVIRTDEEVQIARSTREILGP
jgi:acetate kinase